MNKKRLILTAIVMTGLLAGCTVGTKGEAVWELCLGIRTKQLSEEEGKITIKSSVVDKVVDSLTDGQITETE